MLTLPVSGLMRVSVLRDTAGLGGQLHCYTQGDVARQVQAATDMLRTCGVHRASTVLLAGNAADSRTLDLQYALDGLGATVLPCASAADAVRLMDAVVPDTVIAWEQDLPLLEETLERMALYRLISIGAHPCPQERMHRMAARMGARHTHIFTRASMGVLIGCSDDDGAGIHLDGRLLFAEVIDAAGQGSAADGACGELVLSSLTAEAEPVLRCRTGLHVRLLREQDHRGYEQVRMVEE